MRTAHTVPHAAKVVEVHGVGAEVGAGVGRDLIQDPQELSQDRGLVLEARIIVEIEVVEA